MPSPRPDWHWPASEASPILEHATVVIAYEDWLVREELRTELAAILEAIDTAPWRARDGEQAKRIWFAPSAIERLRSLLAKHGQQKSRPGLPERPDLPAA